MGHLDAAAKILLSEEAAAFIRLAFPGLKVRSVTPDETELHRIERRMDKLLNVEVDGDPDPSPLHFEVEAVWASDVPANVFDKWALVRPTRPGLRSLVIVLQPGDRQAEPRGLFEVFVRGEHVLTFRFGLIRAWDLSVGEIRGTEEPGLLPLVPFAKGATRSDVESAQQLLLSRHAERKNLQIVFAVFAGWVFPDERWMARIPEVIRMESTAYREIHELGRADLLATLVRFKLGKSKKTEALLSRLASCGPDVTDRVARLLVGKKGRAQILASFERLLAKRVKS